MLQIEHDDRHFRVTVPRCFVDVAAIRTHLHEFAGQGTLRGELSTVGRDDVTIRVWSRQGNVATTVARMFARINGHPWVDRSDRRPYRAAADPLVSCIIVLTENDLFVERFLIPSILACTKDCAREIVVVDNGSTSGERGERFKAFKYVRSEYRCVSKAYNAGVRCARGRYIALFHDDCVIDDAAWWSKCVDALCEGYGVVSPELQVQHGMPVAKAVPLVMRRETYDRLGGYDEHYYFGIEDLDFTSGVRQAGAPVGKVDVRSRHFRGMSTVIASSRQPAIFRALFAHHVLPVRTIQSIAAVMLRQARNDEVFRAMLDRDYQYFIRKYRPYIAARYPALIDMECDLRNADRLRRLLDPSVSAILASRADLVRYFRMKARARHRSGTADAHRARGVDRAWSTSSLAG